ncbi:hypothetical protein ACIBEA_41635 [Streptomyces sp. NPDC051555]|uniref:hypothetical protein n=1 Tax=Streptomyces sp. NPDC051555 TaxID=3365657 RepID=UPI003791EEC8
MARTRSWIRRNPVVLGLPAFLTALTVPALVAPVQAQAATHYQTATFGTANGYNYTDCLTNGWATRCKLRGYLYGAPDNYVLCKKWGDEVSDSSGNYNHWWLKTDLDTNLWGSGPAYISAYYLSNWGNDEAKDNSGHVIPNC